MAGALLIMAVAACGPDVPSIAEWRADVWAPLSTVVPQPEAATATSCEEALPLLRTIGAEIRPAPAPELGDAAERWLRAAESLVFDCTSGSEDLDYIAQYELLSERSAEVEVLLSSDP